MICKGMVDELRYNDVGNEVTLIKHSQSGAELNDAPRLGRPEPRPATGGVSGMTTHRPTLLVVDDEPEVLHSVHDLLRLEFRVITCERGNEAMKILEGPEDIHVVMSDQRMPGMTGVEVLRHAKRLRPEATRLMFTAYADIKAVVDAINQGSVFRYITKPWDPEELQLVVRQAVEQHDLIVERDRLMTELKETNQRLLEANRLKGAFIEVASHELNTPVAVVLGMAQLWKLTQGETATASERHWVDRIFSAGKRLAATVERMLKLVRTDDLSRPLDLQRTPLEPLVRGVVDEMGAFRPQSGRRARPRPQARRGRGGCGQDWRRLDQPFDQRHQVHPRCGNH